jgi:Arc/MetJ family transcription regulator
VARTRTTLAIDSVHLSIVMSRYRLKTKTEAVDLALRFLVGAPMSRDEALAMRGAGAIGKVPN